MKEEIIRKNPASPDTPVSKLTVWSITILVFLMKNKNLYEKGLREEGREEERKKTEAAEKRADAAEARVR